MSRLMRCGFMSWAILCSFVAVRADDAEDQAVEVVKKLRGSVTRDEKLPGKNVIRVYLSRTQVTDAEVKELAALKNLNTLHLGDTRVTDAGVKELGALKNLTELNLNRTKVTDAGVKELAGLQSLTLLYLDDTQVTDAGLKELAKLKNLTKLLLNKTYRSKPRERDFRQTGRNDPRNPNSLQPGHAQVTDAGLKELAELKNLTSLQLGGTQVSDAGLKELAGLKNLSTLHLNDTQVTDAGVKELVALRNLTSLSLSKTYQPTTHVTDVGVKELTALKNLNSLQLNGTQVSVDSQRVMRGGYYDWRASICGAAYRHGQPPVFRNASIGFRSALSVEAVKAAPGNPE